MIELYDLGRCTHGPVAGMYEFIVENASKYVADPAFADVLKQHAANRELPGYSVPQGAFSEMCRIWVDAYQQGTFDLKPAGIVFPDTAPRFRRVKQQGRRIGILTSGSEAFTKLLFHVPTDGGMLDELVDEYLLGEQIGDKDLPETHAGLWEKTNKGIYALFDDKVSVHEAALEGLGADAQRVKLYLVDRKGRYQESMGALAERVRELQGRGVQLISSFDQVTN